MSAVVDLPRARRALAELDRIAAAHPEMCQGIGQWDEKTVEKIIMGTPAKDRVKAMRERLAARGIKREIFFATPEAQTALAELRALHPDKTRDNILCDAVINLLAAQRTPDRPAPPVSVSFGRTAMMTTIGELLDAGLTGNEIARRLNAAGYRSQNGAELRGANVLREFRTWKEKKGGSD